MDFKDGPTIFETTKLVLNQQFPNKEANLGRKQIEIPTCLSLGRLFSKKARVLGEVILHLLISSGVAVSMKEPSLESRLSGYPSGYVCGKTVVIGMNALCHVYALCKITVEKPKRPARKKNQSQ